MGVSVPRDDKYTISEITVVNHWVISQQDLFEV